MKPIFIIEHLEPKLWPWCIIEYASISAIVGKNNVLFTNLNTQKLSNYGRAIQKPVSKLAIDFSQACILDPLAKDTLTPKAAKQYSYFIIGGILGEEKLNGRTKRELTAQLPRVHAYNLGTGQFSTDNAVYVTNKIIEGTPLSKIQFKDTIEIPINNIESVILPYRYPIVDGRPRISPELITYLKQKKGF